MIYDLYSAIIPLELPVHRRHVVPGSVQLRFPPHRASIIPYATQGGEISFCAYNTGVGWRNIIEKMHMTATLTKWYEENGRHEIFAGGKSVQLNSKEHSLVLREEIVTNEIQHDLDRLGIAKNAGEEKIRARAAKIKAQEENERMMKLYRQHVLKEEPRADLVSLGEIKPAAPLATIQPAS